MKHTRPLLAILASCWLLSAPAATAQPRPGKAWLGVLLGQDGQAGILIKKVYPGSPAKAAGLKVGDRVLRVAGGGVPTIRAMQQAISAHRPGQTVAVRIQRAGRTKTLSVHLKAMPTYEQRVRLHLLNKPAPAFSVARVGGVGSALITDKSLRGKVTLIEFWASWCGACRQAIPMLKAIHVQYARFGLQIVAIAKDPMSRIQPLARTLRIPYAVGADPRGQTMSAYWINPIPAFVLLDRQGVVRAVAVGAGMSGSFRHLLKTAHQLLTKRPAPVPRRRLPGRRPAPRRVAPGHF